MSANAPGSNDVSDIQMTFGWSNGPAQTAHGTQLFEQDVSQFGDAPASFASGPVGADVGAVTIHRGQTVQATVTGGRYAAWWPGTAYTTGPDRVRRILLRFDLALHDGRTLLNIAPNH